MSGSPSPGWGEFQCLATILTFVFIDPQMSVMTDDVSESNVHGSQFRRAVVWLVGSRLAGTLLA